MTALHIITLSLFVTIMYVNMSICNDCKHINEFTVPSVGVIALDIAYDTRDVFAV